MRKIAVRMCMGIWLALLLLPVPVSGEQPKPMPGTFVHDFAGVIRADRKSEIQAKAQQLKDTYKTEIAVVTVDSLEGEESFDYSMRMARSWGIGSKDDEVRGLLILVAIKDRKTAFRTSRHIEGELPDGVTGDISRQMNLHFKDGDFGSGLSLAMSRVLERLEKVYEAPEKQQAAGGGAFVWLWVLLGSTTFGAIAFFLVQRSRRQARRQAREAERKRALTVTENRRNYFTPEKPTSRQTGQQTRQQKAEKQLRKQEKKRSLKNQRESSVGQGYSSEPGYSSSSSGYDSSSASSYSGTDTDYGSSSYDSGSSSGSDSGSSYSGGSDFGGGGSDSSW